jgi:hypothetical protein
MSIAEKPTHLQTAYVMDNVVTLAREDSVCGLLSEAALANGWKADQEWSDWDSRERIDLLALKEPNNLVIIETKKGYNRADFPAHVAQTARYAARINAEMRIIARNGLENLAGAADRSAYVGRIIGSMVAQDALLVCPGFDEKKTPQHAFEAAARGILAVGAVDAVRYLEGNYFRGVSDDRHALYRQAKNVLAAPAIAHILALD